MAIVFNGIDRLIEVTDPLIFSLDAQKDLYSAWKIWSQDGDNSKYAPAFNLNSVFGGNPTVEGQSAPRYFFLTNFWRVLVDNGNIVSVGLNLYTENYSTPYIVAAGSGISDRNSDAVSVNSEAIEYASFNGGVTIDQDNITGRAVSGTSYPIGTVQQPVNNLTDLLLIAVDRGIDKVYVIGNLDVPGGFDFSRYIFVGESPTKSIITIQAAANVLNCEFEQATISGTIDGNSEISHARVSDLNFVDGKVENSDIGPDTIILGISTNANFFSCFSTVPGNSTPVIDMNGTGILGLRDYNGGIELRNYTGTGGHSIDLSSGQIKLDPTTITGGTFVCRGVGKLVDASNGIPIQTGTWNGGVTIVNELINLITISEAASFADAVYIDTINGVPGITDPIGLERQPVDNLTDAVTIAGIRGTSTLVFLSDYTFLATDNLSSFDIYGINQQITTFTFQSGSILAFCNFFNATLTGNLTGVTGFTDCIVTDLGSVGLAPTSQTVIARRTIFGGTLTLPANYSGTLVVLDCYGELATDLIDYPILNVGDSTMGLVMRNWSGQLVLNNISQNNKIDIGIAQGEVVLDSTSVTSGSIHVAGTGYLYDENEVEIPSGVWNGGVNIENETVTGQGGTGGSSPWTIVEKDEVLQYSKKASDNAEQANLKL